MHFFHEKSAIPKYNFKKIISACKHITTTFSLTFLFTLNLFFIVALTCALVAIAGFWGIKWKWFPSHFWYRPQSWMIVAYTACIMIAVSVVIMIRLMILRPMHKMIAATKQLANGNFDAHMDIPPLLIPSELTEFANAFNTAAGELRGTELLRKDFIHNFSHEFKTPIVSMNGFADLLLNESLSEEDRREYLTIIRDESKRLADLSTNILTLSKLESKTILTEQEVYSLDEQIRQAILITDKKWQQKKLRFYAELSDCNFYGNRSLLSEVWINLLDNAAKFSQPDSEVSVVLRTESTKIIVSVLDHGSGIDAETQRHIFDEFYQGDSSHTCEGNGLGLTMVKKILDLHQAAITVDSAPDQGACFIVTLPVCM